MQGGNAYPKDERLGPCDQTLAWPPNLDAPRPTRTETLSFCLSNELGGDGVSKPSSFSIVFCLEIRYALLVFFSGQALTKRMPEYAQE